MALDGILLHKIIEVIKPSLPARIQKIYQISSTEVLFQIHGVQGKQQLLISCHSQYNRILLTNRSYPTPSEPGNFVMVLRKYLEGSTIESIDQAELDRWCEMSIYRRNDIGDPEKLTVYIELMGKYANMILVNSNQKIIDAMKRIPPFENNRRTIQPGAEFKPTPPQNKHDPFHDPLIDPSLSLTQQFAGFSPFLAKEIEFRMANCHQSFSDIMKEISDSKKLYIAEQDGESPFHCIEIKSIGKCRCYDLMEGFDVLYYHKEEKDRIREISGDLFQVAKRELKHQKMKLPRLLKEFDEANDCDKWRLYGDLLYSYDIHDTKGKKEIILSDLNNGSPVHVPLDPKYNGHQNAQRCYTKYSKLKKGQSYLSDQIHISQIEISYFEGLLEQLEQADFFVAEEIKEELIKGGYMQAEKRKIRKAKNHSLQVTTIHTESGIDISFGRNNMQNDLLTWHLARKNETWLHAKDYHGAHVVIHSSEPDETTLRLAANIAACYSGGRHSSSVPVNWCKVSQLKKIPGAKPGIVQLGSYRTIYIDPDWERLSIYDLNIDQ